MEKQRQLLLAEIKWKFFHFLESGKKTVKEGGGPVEYSERVLARMEEKKVTAYRIAKETGLSESLFSKWRAHPTSDISILTLEKTGACLGLSVEELIGKGTQREKTARAGKKLLCARDYRALESCMISCMEDGVHGVDHVRRVLGFAARIAREEKRLRADILAAACLLHEIGRRGEKKNPALCHARVGSEKARRFLLSIGWPETDAQRVADCILTHRRSKGDPPASREAEILCDADRLDLTGAAGTARAIRYGYEAGEPLYRTGKDGRLLADAEDEPSLIRFYENEIQRLYRDFYTEKAEQIAAEQREIMERFFMALRREAGKANVSCETLRGVLTEPEEKTGAAAPEDSGQK